MMNLNKFMGALSKDYEIDKNYYNALMKENLIQIMINHEGFQKVCREMQELAKKHSKR